MIVLHGRRLQLTIHFSFFAVLLLLTQLTRSDWGLWCVGACLLHEAGHILAYSAFGAFPKAIHLEAGGIRIDKAAHMASIDGKPMELSYKEFELLTYFLENQGIALSREKILNNVWNYDYYGDARTIDTHVKKLRSKMGDKGDLIKTIWGMGYKFEADES
jgi:hypothetical protein